MKKVIKDNLNNILVIFILLQPILDLITGLCIHLFNINLTFGIVIRMLFLIFIMYTSAFVYKKKKSLIVYSVIIIYSIFYLLGIILFKDTSYLFRETQGLLRVFYFPILLFSLYELKEHIRISKMTLITSLVTYLLLIFIPILLGVGYQSYEITKSGTLGFFNSANEISGIISILTPIFFLIFTNKKNIILKSLLAIIYLVVILTVGTKTPILSLGITIGMAFLWLIVKSIKNKKYKPVFITLIILIVGVSSLLVIIPKTNFYKNIEVHMDYLEVDDLSDVLEEPELVDHFIFSQRLTFLNKKDKLYDKANLYQKIFGIGYIKKDKTTKLIEMDYFDIYYSHGIVGFIVFFTIYLIVLVSVLKKRSKLDFEMYMTYISLLLIIFLSLLTGHIITSPAVSIYVITIILSLAKKKKKILLFAAYNMEIGGIEKALVNLVNKINYDKYDVAIILEEKKGVLLDKVNNNVKILEFKVNNNKNIILRKIINYTKRFIYVIFNYHTYDFSCCYATYSLSGNKLSKISSNNSSIYIHSNYKYVYKTEKELRRFFDVRKLNEFRTIIFVSNEARKDYLTYYNELKYKTIVFNNFIDINEILSSSKEKESERKSKDKKLFVFVGRLDDSSKKIGRAINLVKEIKDIDLWIVGDGPDKDMYLNLVKKNNLCTRIKFLGKKTNPYPYMKKADYIILTSDYEGFPVTYLEAIVLKVPIITTIPTSDDKINIEDYANIISKDEKEMIKEVKKIINNKQEKKEVDLDKIQKLRMKELEKIFNEVI